MSDSLDLMILLPKMLFQQGSWNVAGRVQNLSTAADPCAPIALSSRTDRFAMRNCDHSLAQVGLSRRPGTRLLFLKASPSSTRRSSGGPTSIFVSVRISALNETLCHRQWIGFKRESSLRC